MRKLFLLITLFLTPTLFFFKAKASPEMDTDEKRDTAVEICNDLITKDLVGEDHSCHEAVSSGDISAIDELIRRGILEVGNSSQGNICRPPVKDPR